MRFAAGVAYDGTGDRFLVTHGAGAGRRLGDTWAFDLRGERWGRIETGATRPAARSHLQAAFGPEGRLLVFGGESGASALLADSWTLDLGRGLWARSRPVRRPSARARYAGAYEGRTRRWLVFGGRTATGPTGDLWVDPAGSGAWSPIVVRGERPSPRSGAQMVVAGRQLLLFGGRDRRRELAETWMLDLITIA